MTRREEMRIKDQERKEKEIQEFLSNIDVLHNNTDSIVYPSVSIMRGTDDNYITYHVTKYPNMLKYSVSMHKKEYPFNTYYSKEFYKEDITAKYQEQFAKLETYFNK